MCQLYALATNFIIFFGFQESKFKETGVLTPDEVKQSFLFLMTNWFLIMRLMLVKHKHFIELCHILKLVHLKCPFIIII